jgi:hypothetical protein
VKIVELLFAQREIVDEGTGIEMDDGDEDE